LIQLEGAVEKLSLTDGTSEDSKLKLSLLVFSNVTSVKLSPFTLLVFVRNKYFIEITSLLRLQILF